MAFSRRRSPGRDRGPAASVPAAASPSPPPPRSVLDAVATRLRLPSARRTRELLTGEHRSVHHGRSLELDDLRQYTLGDDVRDVDWKASARTGTVLMRRHAAERKQRVILVVDTGVEMGARSAGGGSKRDLVVLAAGFVGLVAAGAADLVGLVAGDAAGRLRAPARSGRAHLELVLRQLEDRLARSVAAADVLGLLDDVRRVGDRRSFVVVITDDGPFTDEHVEALRRLRLRHDVLWLTVRDADLTDVALTERDLVDVTGAARLPALLRDDAELRASYQQSVRAATDLRRRSLHRLGIASADIAHEADVVPAVARLLDRVGRG